MSVFGMQPSNMHVKLSDMPRLPAATCGRFGLCGHSHCSATQQQLTVCIDRLTVVPVCWELQLQLHPGCASGPINHHLLLGSRHIREGWQEVGGVGVGRGRGAGGGEGEVGRKEQGALFSPCSLPRVGC